MQRHQVPVLDLVPERGQPQRVPSRPPADVRDHGGRGRQPPQHDLGGPRELQLPAPVAQPLPLHALLVVRAQGRVVRLHATRLWHIPVPAGHPLTPAAPGARVSQHGGDDGRPARSRRHLMADALQELATRRAESRGPAPRHGQTETTDRPCRESPGSARRSGPAARARVHPPRPARGSSCWRPCRWCGRRSAPRARVRALRRSTPRPRAAARSRRGNRSPPTVRPNPATGPPRRSRPSAPLTWVEALTGWGRLGWSTSAPASRRDPDEPGPPAARGRRPSRHRPGERPAARTRPAPRPHRPPGPRRCTPGPRLGS